MEGGRKFLEKMTSTRGGGGGTLKKKKLLEQKKKEERVTFCCEYCERICVLTEEH